MVEEGRLYIVEENMFIFMVEEGRLIFVEENMYSFYGRGR